MTADLLALMMTTPVSGPIIDARLIPEPLRSEYLSVINFDTTRFPNSHFPLGIRATDWTHWCGCRLSPDYRSPMNMQSFTKEKIESLSVTTYPAREMREEIQAVFKPGGFLVNLMKEGKRVGRVAFGYPHTTSFEWRHAEWICTSAVICTYSILEQQVIYTKSGSDYRLLHRFNEIERPVEILPRLRQGFSPDDIRVIDELEKQGFIIGDPIY